MRIIFIILITLISIGCKPDNLEIEVYTSDLESAQEGDVITVPVKASFSLMGDDESGDLERARIAAMKYLSGESEFTIASGDMGKSVRIVTEIPMGKEQPLRKHLIENPSPAMLVVEGNLVRLEPTRYLDNLNNEMSNINFMLSAELPGSVTSFRIVSDSKEKKNISATAVFSEKVAYLQFSKDIKKRKSVVIDFFGGDGSVYKEIPPQFVLSPSGN